ncbi:doublecortin domain-containing protein 1-like isoform X2 [Lineus longissimus]|uniref:doublecortin domain-containing protein 1-like isoform X2 n=1 Tax=Lineus longissimus TaxID=88925 RepID=UPI00315D1406
MPSKADRDLGPKRPQSGKVSSVVSYEDMIIAQYLDELKKSPPYTKKSHHPPQSPYSQRLSSSQIVAAMAAVNARQKPPRPQSAKTPTTSSGKPKIDPKFIADPEKWDPATPRESVDVTTQVDQKKKNMRPASAPAGNHPNRRRPLSAYYGGSTGRMRPQSAKSGTSSMYGRSRKIKSLYKRQPETIVVTAFKNGSRDTFCKVAASSLKLLLEMCTDKLPLPLAARRLFLCDGKEVFEAHDIPRGAEVYVSMGEDYKDHMKHAVYESKSTNSATWTMNGLVIPHTKKRKTKPLMTKRFKTLIDRPTLRIMVYKNGCYTDGTESVADPRKWQLFLDGISSKLELRSPCRILYDWEGNPVVQITQNWDGTEKITVNEIPKLMDPCMQTTSTSQVLGPLWASSGEGFSPLAATNHLKSLMKQVKTRLDESNRYKQQLRLAQSGLSEQVNIVTINSMTDLEIENGLSMVDCDIKDFTNMKQKLKQYLNGLKSEMVNEVDEGNSYKLRHIQKFEMENKLVDIRRLRLVVYKNGSYESPVNVFFNMTDARRGIGDDKQKMLEKLLDTVASSCKHYSEEGEQGMTARKWKLFDKSGQEVLDVFKLEQEQEVWFTFGDPYKSPFTFCLQGTFDRVRGFMIVTTTKEPAKKKSVMDNLIMAGEGEEDEENGLPTTTLEAQEEVAVVMEEKQVLVREQLMMDPELLNGKDKASAWRTCGGPPENFKFEKPSPYDQELIASMIEQSEIGLTNDFLASKDDSDFVLFPELSVATKKPKGHTSVWPADAQIWVISKEGYIYMKPMPSLVLTVTATIVKVDLPNSTEVEGYAVGLKKKVGDATQMWQFGGDGFITAESQPELALTYLGGVIDNEETIQKPADDPSIPPGHKYFVTVCEKLPRKDAKYQRWALKQERTDIIGQWKHSTVENPEWNKRALSWPVDKDGEINEKFDWPMEGYLIPYAPPVENPRKPSVSTTMRLLVLRNGDKDPGCAVPIVGPDLTNMSKDLKKTQNGKTNKHARRSSRDNKENNEDSVANGQSLHCSDLSLQQLEFRLFLEHCTSMLNLPFAARRLFDDQGHEHFTIRDTLLRDQLVYISCGEPWTDPKLTKAEQQRRFLLANLSADIAQIRQFVALRKPEGFVLEVEGGLTPSARLIINKSAISPEEDKADENEAPVEVEEKDEEVIAQEEMMQSLLNEKLSAHDRSHQRSERRLENLRWPWERIMEQDENDDLDEEERKKEEAFTSKEMYRKYKPKHPVSPRYPRLHLQKFTYTDGFLACASKPELVLGVTEGEGRASEVTLKKRNVDDIFQRWIISSSGLIKAKHNQKMVLSVTMPTNLRRDDQSMTLSYANSSIVLLQHKNTQFGRSNQKFMFDHDTGLIQAFYTDFLDKEITAANKANICTFAVIGDTELDQPGYEVEYPLPNNQMTKLVVCASCARAMRGRFKTQKIIKNVDFACAMGQAQDLGVKQVGSFQCLNGKVDLSTFEAEHTLEAWEDQLERLRKERSVRNIAREISQARSPLTVKVAAYLNGEGRMAQAELIFASSIPGLLQQCTDRLHAHSAVRRLYTSDGIIILDIDDLIQWGVDHHILMLKKAKVAEMGGEAPKVAEEAKEGQPQDEEGEKEDIPKPENDETEPNVGEGQEEGGQELLEGHEGVEVQGQTEKNEQDELADLVHIEVQIPPVETILRYPIELWASVGEKFKPPAAVVARTERKKKWQEERSAVVQELETEKHVLRQMQGRRLQEGSPGNFKGTNDPDQPVLIEGNWQEPTEEEQQKHDTVHQLQTHLSEVKHTQDSDSLKTCNQATSHRLYGQPQMRRVQVYPNGESLSRAVYVWGESLAQILDNATMRLNLRKHGKILFDVTGKQIGRFGEIERDMLLCVSMGKPYMKPRDVKEDIEIKANWSRARKKYGPRATDIEVFTNKNPRVDVDPFGPPSLAEAAGKKPPRPKSAKKTTPAVDDDTEFIDEMQNGQTDEM